MLPLQALGLPFVSRPVPACSESLLLPFLTLAHGLLSHTSLSAGLSRVTDIVLGSAKPSQVLGPC